MIVKGSHSGWRFSTARVGLSFRVILGVPEAVLVPQTPANQSVPSVSDFGRGSGEYLSLGIMAVFNYRKPIAPQVLIKIFFCVEINLSF
jgi:hypothetical protein